MSHLVAPRLFGVVGKYAKSVGQSASAADVHDDDILYFCDQFYMQFFQNALRAPITGPNDISKAKAVQLFQRMSTSQGDPTPEVALIAKFIDLVKDWDKIRGATYASSDEFATEFHCIVLPELLASILTWTRSTSDEELINAVAKAEREYARAMATICL